MSNANVKRNQNEQKQSHYIKLDKPLEFKGTINSMMTTSFELSKTINGLFKEVFGDYEGSTIGQNQFGQAMITLYFRDNGSGDILPLAVQSKRGTPIDRIHNMNMRNRNKTFKLSDELKDVLRQFMYPPRGKDINWDAAVHEVFERVYGSHVRNIYVKVDNIDINKILQVLYGSKNEDGERLLYDTRIIKTTGMMVEGINQNYVIKIDQLNEGEVNKLAKQVGGTPSIGNIPMIREY